MEDSAKISGISAEGRLAAESSGAPSPPETPGPSQSSSFIHLKEASLPERIGGYQILRKIGAGGMGAVYEGLNESIERRVAIKILHARYSHDPETARRFINEARAVNRIDHPGVVQISDHGQLDDGSAYIVMELLHGESLGTRLRRCGALAVGESIDLAAQIAEALTAAHARNIIHRDLKPDNVMVVSDRQMPTGERIKVLDFGIAKLTEGERSNAGTQTSAMLGTPFYMSPEQARGSGKVDDKTDVYSLGVILFEMLVGKPPFDGEGTGELIMKHMSEPPPELAQLAPASPPELVVLVKSLLEKDRANRPNMAQVAEQLEVLRELHPRPRRHLSQAIPILRVAPPADVPGKLSTMGRAVGQTLPRAPGRLLAAGVGAVVLFGSLLTVGLLSTKNDSRSAAPPGAVVPNPEVPAVAPPPPAASPLPAPPPAVTEPAAIPPIPAGTAEVPAHPSAPVRRVKRPKVVKTSPVKAVPTRRPIED